MHIFSVKARQVSYLMLLGVFSTASALAQTSIENQDKRVSTKPNLAISQDAAAKPAPVATQKNHVVLDNNSGLLIDGVQVLNPRFIRYALLLAPDVDFTKSEHHKEELLFFARAYIYAQQHQLQQQPLFLVDKFIVERAIAKKQMLETLSNLIWQQDQAQIEEQVQSILHKKNIIHQFSAAQFESQQDAKRFVQALDKHKKFGDTVNVFESKIRWYALLNRESLIQNTLPTEVEDAISRLSVNQYRMLPIKGEKFVWVVQLNQRRAVSDEEKARLKVDVKRQYAIEKMVSLFKASPYSAQSVTLPDYMSLAEDEHFSKFWSSFDSVAFRGLQNKGAYFERFFLFAKAQPEWNELAYREEVNNILAGQQADFAVTYLMRESKHLKTKIEVKELLKTMIELETNLSHD